MPIFVIFVEGTDTEPSKIPIYIVETEEHASLICEGMKESEYQIFDFSFKHCTRSDRGKFAVWSTMICDARAGIYGNIVGAMYKLIDGAYWTMSGRRLGDKPPSGAAPKTDAICEPAVETLEAKSAAGKAAETVTKVKRSTQPNEASEKLKTALCSHHGFDGVSCTNFEPIGSNALCRLAGGLGKASGSRFFTEEFGELPRYKAACANNADLIFRLKLLRGEVKPRDVPSYGHVPPGEGNDDE